MIVTKKDFPAKDLKEFVAYIKAKKGDKVNQAHAGVGSVSHTTCELLNRRPVPRADRSPTAEPARL